MINELTSILSDIFRLEFIHYAKSIVTEWVAANPQHIEPIPSFLVPLLYFWIYGGLLFAFVFTFLLVGMFVKDLPIRVGISLIIPILLFLLPITALQRHEMVETAIANIIAFFQHAPIITTLPTALLLLCALGMTWYVFRGGVSLVGKILAFVFVVAFTKMYVDFITPTSESGAVIALSLVGFLLIFIIFYVTLRLLAGGYEMVKLVTPQNLSLFAVATALATFYVLGVLMHGIEVGIIITCILAIWILLREPMAEKAEKISRAREMDKFRRTTEKDGKMTKGGERS